MTYCSTLCIASRWGLGVAILGVSACFAPTNTYVDTDAATTTGDDSDPSATTVSTTATTTTTASTTDTSMTSTTASTTVDPSTTETADTTDTDPTTSTEDSSASDPTPGSDPSASTSSESTGGEPECGNGEPEGDEECDDGNLINTDACKNDCTNAICGDGVVGPKEECDDGNDDDSDPCTTNCTDAECGDGFEQGGEQCDDGNLVDHDGCDNTCIEEPFCEFFVDVDCPSGATMFCDTSAITCDSSDDAISACEACVGEGASCQPFQDVDSCNEGSGVVDQDSDCPGVFNFVYQGDVCNNGIITDNCGGGTLGTWCTP